MDEKNQGLIDTFNNRLKKAMQIRNIKAVELSEKTGISKSSLSEYISGKYEAKQNGIYLLSKALNVSEAWLMGLDVPMERKHETRHFDFTPATVFVYGTIPAGIPIECIEDILDTEEIPSSMLNGGKQYFGLRVKGNSMYPDYLDGDTLIIEKQDDCESGDDCIVMVNGYDGTFKRVIKNEEAQTIRLQPLNTSLDENGMPLYEPITFTKEQIEQLPVRILGVVVEIRRKKRRK